ncbi:uncharacterized protein LOC126909715, partial [Daktulosphaira vitifoliae]|uniref:uncharacterized protein LOC126909715 n=1 Tax=Daktulosphaira vitifoliae TaxID=58002 RepID=UPI0021AA7AFB
MMPLSDEYFYNINKFSKTINILAGMPLFVEKTNKYYQYYCYIVDITLFFGFIAITSSVFYSDEIFDKLKSIAVGASSLSGLLNSMYQRYNYKRNQHIMNDLQCISVNFQNDQPIECFVKKMKSDIWLTNKLLLFVVIIAALTIPLFLFWDIIVPQDGMKIHTVVQMEIPFIDASDVLEYWLKSILLTLIIKCGFIHLRKNLSYDIECKNDVSLFYGCIKCHQNII